MPIVKFGKMTHTTLESAGIKDSLRFYREVMGLKTLQILPKVGIILSSPGCFFVSVEVAKRAPQPFFNFYVRPVCDAAAVDATYARMVMARGEYGIQELTMPKSESPVRFGPATYGFVVKDVDGNWWRVEENNGPLGLITLPEDAEPRGSLVPAGPISYVTLECKNPQYTQQFYSDFLGLDVEIAGADCLFTRGNGGIPVIGVRRGDEVVPQPIMNHHGITLRCDETDIDEIYRIANERASAFGIKKIMPTTRQHGSYSFYLQDQDTNWWEIETWENHVDPWTRGGGL